MYFYDGRDTWYIDEQKSNQRPKQTQQQKIKNAVREGKLIANSKVALESWLSWKPYLA